MRQYEKVGIVLNQKFRKFSSKIYDKWTVYIFTDYSLQHGEEVFSMYNMKTQRIIVT